VARRARGALCRRGLATAALSAEERAQHLDGLTSAGWSLSDGSDGRETVSKTFQFADFVGSWGFMSQVAIVAEKADHHPEWFNVYNRVEVTLTTHDADNKLSMKDVRLAAKMDEIAA